MIGSFAPLFNRPRSRKEDGGVEAEDVVELRQGVDQDRLLRRDEDREPARWLSVDVSDPERPDFGAVTRVARRGDQVLVAWSSATGATPTFNLLRATCRPTAPASRPTAKPRDRRAHARAWLTRRD